MKHSSTQRLAYSYVRMSTEKQKQGDSLRRQLDWSASFAERHSLDLQNTDAFADIGVSAWKGLNRSKGRLGAFIQLVKDGNIPASSYLLIENLDRLSRTTPLEALDLFKEILTLGITVVARGEWGDEEIYTWQSLNSNSNQLISTLTTMLRANRESERKSQIIREAFANKRVLSRQGIKTNQTPPHWIDARPIAKGQFEYELNDRAPLVQWIFERSADGVGFDRIARELNQRGEPTLKPSKRGWWHTSVANIVTNRSAIGEYQPYEGVDGARVAVGDPIADYYPAVVTNDLWLRAQKIVHQNRKGGRAGTAFSNLFSNMAFCSHCQSTMHMISNTRSEKQWSYLVCSANHRKQMKTVDDKLVPICEGERHRFRYKNVEKFILDNVTEFGVSDLMQMRRADDELQALNEQHADCVVKLDALRFAEQRLLQFIQADAAGDIPALVQEMKARKQEREAAEQRLQDLQNARDVAQAKQRALDPVSAIKAMREQWETTEDADERYGLRVRCNRAMRDFIDYVTFDGSDASFMVILFGGLRAYKFTNPKFARNSRNVQSDALSQKPLMVDMTRLMQEVPLGRYIDTEGPNASPDMEHSFTMLDKASAQPMDGSVRVSNDMQVRARKNVKSSN